MTEYILKPAPSFTGVKTVHLFNLQKYFKKNILI